MAVYQSIWIEPFDELIARWVKRQPEKLREEIGSRRAAEERALDRADKIVRFANIPPRSALKTPREWETRWRTQDVWTWLEGLMRVRRRDIVWAEGSGRDLSWQPAALAGTDREAVVLVEAALHEQLEAVRATEGKYPLKLDDLAVFALTRELYDYESVRSGKRSRPWVEELAQHEFTRRLLGLPFHPLLLDVITRR